MGIATLLKGENLLLTGPKATGKNMLAENLAWIFARPVYNISFHVNTDSGDLIGTDTFENNEVKLRKGSIYRCAEYGGFGILDEINMAKNDAVSLITFCKETQMGYIPFLLCRLGTQRRKFHEES